MTLCARPLISCKHLRMPRSKALVVRQSLTTEIAVPSRTEMLICSSLRHIQITLTIAQIGGSFARRHRRCVTFREGNPANSAPPVRCELSTAHRGAWRTIASATGVNQGSEAGDGIVAGVYGGG